MTRSLYVLVLCAVANHLLADNNSTSPPIYAVNRILDVAPTIDGVISDGEWDTAAPSAGDFVELNSGALDTHNLRFRLLWDDQSLYVLGETDFTGFGSPLDALGDPNLAGLTYAYTLLIDPNRDGENLAAARTDDDVDGYQITWGMDEGFTSRAPTPAEPNRPLRDPRDSDGLFLNDNIPGLLLESHVNSISGNDGGWDQNDEGPSENYRDDTHPGLVFAQFADNAVGGVFEWSIAWSELNATDPNRLLSEADGDAVLTEIEDPFDPSRTITNPDFLGSIGDPDPRFADPESDFFLENGLYAPTGPLENELWTFEIGAITPDSENSTPSWSQPKGGDSSRTSLAAWGSTGHGRIIFLGDPAVPFDCNEDGVLDSGDLTCVTSETVGETLDALGLIPGDLDGDGEVAFGDFLTLANNFGKTEDINYTSGDINVDGEVAFSDFLTIANNFGKVPAASATAIPEPNSFALLLLGAGLAILSRRRR